MVKIVEENSNHFVENGTHTFYGKITPFSR